MSTWNTRPTVRRTISASGNEKGLPGGHPGLQPSILVLDEPTANLDPRGRRKFIQLIQGLEATKLIATHDLEMVLEICPRAILLDAGAVVTDGDSRESWEMPLWSRLMALNCRSASRWAEPETSIDRESVRSASLRASYLRRDRFS